MHCRLALINFLSFFLLLFFAQSVTSGTEVRRKSAIVQTKFTEHVMLPLGTSVHTVLTDIEKACRQPLSTARQADVDIHTALH